MVKKIGVFVTILGLVFVGIPQFNSKAQTEEDIDYSNLYFGHFFYEEGGTSDAWILRPSVKYYEPHEIGNNIELINGRAYWFGSLGDLVEQRILKYGDYTVPIFTLNSNGPFRFNEDDVLNIYNGPTYVRTELSSIFMLMNNNLTVMTNGDIFMQYYDLHNYISLEYTKDFSFDPDYYLGYNEGLEQGFKNGEHSGYFDGFQEGQYLGYELGFDDGELSGYDTGYDTGYNAGLISTDATGFTALLTTVFGGLAGLLAIEILPNIHIGAIIAVPLVFGIIFFILGKRKGD